MRALSLALVLGACSTNGGATHPSVSGTGGTGGTSGSGGSAGSAASTEPIGADTTELVTVTSASWSAVPATLRRYERAGAGAAWTAVGDAIPVVIGKSGLAWGIGLHPPPSDGGPVKHEGDGCSPAGVFALGTAFGYATPDQATWLKMPYVQATDDLECVDDPASSHYNTLVHRSTVGSVDWQSSEQMHRTDTLYRWGLFIDHNSDPPKPGAGSCIFLHLWSGLSSSTVGCTAGDETQIKTVLGWLDPARHPLLVQLPQSIYDAHRVDWALP